MMGSKRKSTTAASPNTDERASKRQKTPDSINRNSSASAQTVKQVGNKFLDQLRNARDKVGRLISTSFLDLPDRDEVPEYYEFIKLPISVNLVQSKLDNGDYATISQIESDMKRMVNNAKQYNENKSDVYQDAERIRKMTSNFMVKNNPAYKNKDYVAVATPLPEGLEQAPFRPLINRKRSAVDVLENEDSAKRAKTERASRSVSAVFAHEEPAPVPATYGDLAVDENNDFRGKTFQEAQEAILHEIIGYKDEESELEIFTPFVNLPPRTLTDYYHVIKQPMSLKAVQKKIGGVHGRQEVTGVTDMKSWEAFEAEMAKIWNNAREYNEDGSEISLLAGELEEYFKQRLAEARKAVEEPQQPTLKLNLKQPNNSGLKIRLGTQAASPAPQTLASTPTPTPGTIVDLDALRRQRELVQAGSNGYQSQQEARSASHNSADPVARSISITAGSPPVVTNGVAKSDSQGTGSPAVQVNGQPANGHPVNGVQAMPPPSSNGPRPSSANAYPMQQGQTPADAYIPLYTTPPTGFGSRFRQHGSEAKDALIQSLRVRSHPDLRHPKPIHYAIPPHPKLSQQSITLNLAPTHYNLRLEPFLHDSLAPPAGRPYKFFVTANNQRVQPLPRYAAVAPVNAGPSFDVKLMPGMNRIDAECVSVEREREEKGKGKEGDKEKEKEKDARLTRSAGGPGQLEMEKITIFVHLLRG